MACFTNESEVKAGDLADTEELPEEKHIHGLVFMLWPVVNNNYKLQLKMGSDTLDVVFEGPGVEQLGFMAKDMVRIALKGARKEPKKAGSSKTLPFKLVFSNGAIVHLLASQKREKDKIVDLFKDIEEIKRRADEDWFCPPTTMDHLEIDPFIQAPPQSSELLDLDAPATPVLLPSLQTPLEPPPHHKHKRIKKRDMRLARNSIGSTASDTTLKDVKNPVGSNAENPVGSDAQNPVGSDVQKPLGRKAKKRRAARLAKAEAENARVQPPSTPPPPRDPALDLLAGFHSEKGGQYTPIGHIAPGMVYSLVGIVLDVGETKTTRTGERSKSFVLVDPSKCNDSGVTVNVFASPSDEELLPSTRLGQVLLLRNVKVKEFFGKPQGTCYKDSFKWCGYDPAQGKHFYTFMKSSPSSIGLSVLRSHCDHFFEVTAAELEYFVKISDWWRALNEAHERNNGIDNNQGTSHTHVVSQKHRHSRKLATISGIEVGVFVDCVVELLGIWKSDINTTISVTDYSEHEHLYDHAETNDYPIGRRTLTVTLWDGPHAMADDLEVKSFYLLENIKIKMGSGGYLEGSIGYQDRGVRKIGSGSTQTNLSELLSRKKAYEENPHYLRIGYNKEHAQVPEPMQQGHNLMRDEESSVSRSGGAVECLHMDQRCSSIEELLKCTMCPNRFRIRVRIIEYYPRHIGDFVIVECNGCGKILDVGYHLCPDCGNLTESSTTVRYQFAIRVADQSGELNISVTDEEADMFLTGLSARDARDNTEALRTRLSPLLGHLYRWHEGFDDVLNKKPGACLDMCVYSWVPEAVETVRLYKLFGCHLGVKGE